VAILAVIAAFGFAASPLALAAIPVIFLTGLCFAALGLIMTALAPSYDFFMYYFTLVITPMTLLSGVFFPRASCPTRCARWPSGCPCPTPSPWCARCSSARCPADRPAPRRAGRHRRGGLLAGAGADARRLLK
jgi:hypothetical protein